MSISNKRLSRNADYQDALFRARFCESHICYGGKSSPAPPPAPDYAGAAKASQTSQMSNQYTPYGSQTYSANSSAPSGYDLTTNLTPSAQNTLDIQQNLSNNMGNLANSYLPNVNSGAMDLSSIQDVSDRAYGQQTERLDPQWASRDESQEASLRNQGLVAGDQAYDAAMRDYNYAKNDAYTQARTQADATMPQTYQLASSIYNQPLNYENAIRSGAQIQNPQFQQTPGANYLGAAQAQSGYNQGLYNSQVSQQNSTQAGLFGLGAAGAGMFGNMYPYL